MRKSESVMSYSDSYKLSYSDLFRVSIDPRVKPEGDRKESVLEGDERGRKPECDGRWKNMPEGNGIINMYRDDNLYKVMPQFGANRQTIFELDEKLNNRKIPRIFCDAKNRDDFNLRMTVLKIGSSLDDCLRNRVMSVLMICILVSSTSMTGIVRAECTPTPDCASIGYTETSCDGKFVRCPFDTSKLFCVPCDSAYKYTCSGVGYASGSGTACNGKYVNCICASGYEWSGSACVVKPDCNVGYIYYSDKTCSSDVVNGKTAIGIVVKKNELIVALNVPDMYWASSYVDVSGVTNYTSSTNVMTDYNGKANTLAIVSTYTSDTTSNNAAIYCNKYTTAGTSAGQWYLPAMGELYDYIYNQYSTVKTGWDKVGTTISDSWFWSSSEYSNYRAWGVLLSDGMQYSTKGDYNHSVSCLLDIR